MNDLKIHSQIFAIIKKFYIVKMEEKQFIFILQNFFKEFCYLFCK